MKPVFLFLTFAGLLARPATAQRLFDEPAAHDPFGKRTVAARAVPGGRYAGHSLVKEYQTPTSTRNYNVKALPINGQEQPLRPVKEVQSAQETLRIKATDGSTLQILPWAPGVIKVSYFAPGRALTADSSVSIVQPPQPRSIICREGCDGPPSPSFLARNPDFCRGVSTTPSTVIYNIDCLNVFVEKGTLGVRVENFFQGTTACDAIGTFRREAAIPTAATNIAPGGTAVRFRLAPGERLYGTGSRALPLDRRGYRLELYNQAHYASQNGEQNLNITLPVVLSSRGYMLVFDHYTAGYLDLGKTDQDVLEYGGEGLTSLSYFVVTGKNQAEILERYTALTGRQPLPPRWALGLIQSRFGYKTQDEMLNVAARMRRENFPLDAMVLDLFWFGGTTRQGDLTWDKPHFPDPAGMMARLKTQGVKTVLISEPYVMRTSRNDSTVRTLGLVGTDGKGRPYTVGSFWAGPASILDVFKPSARAWLWSYYKTLHDQGAAGWWSDLGEPENHPEAMRHVFNRAVQPTRQVHNAYGQAWADILQTNYTKTYPNERLFNLARSGWAGMQRNSVFPWSGDINRSWSGFQAQVPVMLGMGQAGVSYMHSDAGGFCVGGVDAELYARWLQMASLCPILRPHGEGVPPEPYWYPEPYKSAVRAATHLRYELLPYLYSLAYENSLKGMPLARTMDYGGSYSIPPKPATNTDEWGAPARHIFLNDNNDLANLNTQYLLGPNLLVAPVQHPSQRRRNVVLPAGSWIDFHTNHTYPGGQTVGVAAPLARTPLLVRAGAFIPMTTYRPSTSLYKPDTLLLRYYPDPQASQSEFTMYDDDGHSAQALARKQYETFTARGFYSTQQTDVVLSSAGEYPGQPVFRLLRLLVQRVAAPPTAVLLDGDVAPAEGWTFDPKTHVLEVHFLMNAGLAISLKGLKLLTQPAPDLDPDALTLEAPDQRSFGPGGTTLHYTCRATSAAPTPLHIRNAQGQTLQTLNLVQSTTAHDLRWDGRDGQGQPLPPGVYVAEAAGQHQRLILTK